MTARKFRLTNGVSFGVRYTVVAADVTAGGVLIDFDVDYPLAAGVLLTKADGTVQDIAGSRVTYPANGQVRLDSTGLVSGQVLTVVAQRARLG